MADWEQLLVDCLPDILQRDDEGAIASASVELLPWQQLVAAPTDVLLIVGHDSLDPWILPASPVYSKVLWARPPPAASSIPV